MRSRNVRGVGEFQGEFVGANPLRRRKRVSKPHFYAMQCAASASFDSDWWRRMSRHNWVPFAHLLPFSPLPVSCLKRIRLIFIDHSGARSAATFACFFSESRFRPRRERERERERERKRERERQSGSVHGGLGRYVLVLKLISNRRYDE